MWKRKRQLSIQCQRFYKAPEITKEDQTLKATLTTLNNKLNKTITVDINGEKVAFDKTQIQNAE